MKRPMKHKGPFKTLTLRNLPPELTEIVREKAKQDNSSFSQALVALLNEKLLESRPKERKKRDLSWMVGQWTDEEARIMEESLKEQRKIDPDIWR
jgi:hypothetical protein